MTYLKSIALALGILLLTSDLSVGAQNRVQRKVPHEVHKETPGPKIAVPVSVVSSPKPEYLSGEASVTVRGNENAIIRLGLAQGGVTLVEFPAADHFFALHPGKTEMVTIDDSPTKARDHFFVFRAGSAFLPPPPGIGSPGPSASIIAQMRSGLVITFLIYPVPEISEMAHRVVVSYNRDEVIAARKLAGLAVNLDEILPPPALVTSLRIAETKEVKQSDTQTSKPPEAPLRPVVITESVYGGRMTEADFGKVPDIEGDAHKALKSAVASPARLKNWSEPLHGIAMTIASTRDLKPNLSLAVIAVRNTLTDPIRIVPGHPEITIETRDDKGRTLLVEYVRKLVVESSGTSESIPGGATLFYAIVFPRPILGVRQSLRVAVAQANAADEPVATDLVASGR